MLSNTIIINDVSNSLYPDINIETNQEITPKIVYPKNLRKYMGSVVNLGSKNRYTLKCAKLNINKNEYYDNHLTAIKVMKKTSNELGLTKNVMYDYGTYMEMVLSKNKRMKFSKESLEIAEQYTWYCAYNDYMYSSTRNGPKTLQFHNLVMNHEPSKLEFVYHINGNTLDNRLENLRIITRAAMTIAINTKSGLDGIKYSKKRNLWTSSYYVNGKHVKKSFSCNKYNNAFELAKKFRNDGIADLETYKEAIELLGHE